MGLKDKIKGIVLGYRATSESYLEKLRLMGVKIGEDVKLYRPYNTTIDLESPHLLKIGSHVQITGPVTILTHDYSWCVLKHVYGEILGNQKAVTIGNNVFIGWGSTILGGADIGDNVVIGAYSVVLGKIDSNAVYAGNPAKKIMTLESFYEKRKIMQDSEAKQFVRKYRERFGGNPPIEKMQEYFFLFTNGDTEKRSPVFDKQLRLTNNYEMSHNHLANNKPLYENYEEFLSAID